MSEFKNDFPALGGEQPVQNAWNAQAVKLPEPTPENIEEAK
jgi:hypothetical protein